MSYVWSTLYVPTMSITWLAERGIGVLRSLVTASLPQDIFFLLYFISFIYLGVGVLRSSVEYLCHKIVYPQSTFFTPHHPDQIGVDYYLLRARLAFICNKGESLGKEGGNGCLAKRKIWFLFMIFFLSIWLIFSSFFLFSIHLFFFLICNNWWSTGGEGREWLSARRRKGHKWCSSSSLLTITCKNTNKHKKNGAAIAAPFSQSRSRFWNKQKGPSIALSASTHTEVILHQVDSRTFSLTLCFYWTLFINPETYYCQPLSLTDSLIAHICLPALSDVLREAPFWNVLFPYGHCPNSFKHVIECTSSASIWTNFGLVQARCDLNIYCTTLWSALEDSSACHWNNDFDSWNIRQWRHLRSFILYTLTGCVHNYIQNDDTASGSQWLSKFRETLFRKVGEGVWTLSQMVWGTEAMENRGNVQQNKQNWHLKSIVCTGHCSEFL